MMINVCVVEWCRSDVSDRSSESRYSDECRWTVLYSDGFHSAGRRVSILLDITVVLSIIASTRERNNCSSCIWVRKNSDTCRESSNYTTPHNQDSSR